MTATISALVSATKVLRFGDSGPDVVALQLALKKIGYQLTGTGYFGSQTDTAVETFQRKVGLPVDGDVGPRTAALIDAAVVSPTTTQMATLEEIERPLWLQVSLDHLGLKEAPGSANNKELVADIKTVAEDYQNDATPWCAGWVSFCLAKAGQKPSSKPLWALSYADPKEPFVRLPGPAVGAIAVKKRNGGGHVTFVAGRTRGNALACCGGNQNDSVNISPYAASVFVGFYWPKGIAPPPRIGISSLPIVTTGGKVLSEA